MSKPTPMTHLRYLFILSLFSLFFIQDCFSQDDHYWAQQYGAVSTLMGGAVVGGCRDNASVFYNPGALGFIKYPNLSVDANLYKIDKIYFVDGGGEGINLNSMQFAIYPQIVSGLVQIKKLPKFRFGYVVLTRNYASLLMNSRNTDHKTLQNTPLPDYKCANSIDYANQLNEQWFGTSVGYRVNDRLGIGASFFVSYRTQTYQLSNLRREIYSDGDAGQSESLCTQNMDEVIKYKYFGILAKIGVNYETGRWKFGIAVTTPSVHIYGSGDVQREISEYSSSESQNFGGSSFILRDDSKGTRAAFHHPFSISFGLDYEAKTTRLALSGEYFSAIKQYKILNPGADPFLYPPEYKDSAVVAPYLPAFLQVESASQPVFNIGVGLEQSIGNRFLFLLGANTDFSSYKDIEGGDLLLHGEGSWDLYHLSTGLSYHTEKQMITLGFSYTFSPGTNLAPYTNLTIDDEQFNAHLFAQSFAVVLGFTYYVSKLGK